MTYKFQSHTHYSGIIKITYKWNHIRNGINRQKDISKRTGYASNSSPRYFFILTLAIIT